MLFSLLSHASESPFLICFSYLSFFVWFSKQKSICITHTLSYAFSYTHTHMHTHAKSGHYLNMKWSFCSTILLVFRFFYVACVSVCYIKDFCCFYWPFVFVVCIFSSCCFFVFLSRTA